MEREISSRREREAKKPWRSYSFGFMASSSSFSAYWPPRSYPCSFCKREFRSAQALGGHMNVHRRDRARLIRHGSPPPPPPSLPRLLPNLNYPPPPPTDDVSLLGCTDSVLISTISCTATPPAAGPEDEALDLELRLGVSSPS